MPRVVKSAHARKEEILDTAAALFAERGYTHTSVQAVIDAVGISKGAFYHHFSSKSDLLDALIARLSEAGVAMLRRVADDPESPAIEKLVEFHRRIGDWKLESRALMLDLGHALSEDANALVLLRRRRAVQEAYTPLLASIIEQGVAEAAFDVQDSALAARIVGQIAGSMSEALAGALLDAAGEPVSVADLEAIHDAYARAIERVLGAPEGSLPLVEPDAFRSWIGNGERPSPAGP